MSSSGLLSIGTRALAANLSALQVTGNNIANVNTPGYSRQTAQLKSSIGQFAGNGFYGKGVDVATVERAHSEYLTRQAIMTRAVAAADQARTQKLALVEPVFAAGENGIGASINGALNAFADVASMPADMSARQVVLARADEMASRMRDAAARIDTIGQGINSEVSLAVDQVNDLAGQVAALNGQIANLAGLGHSPNDLLDARERLIGQINDHIQTTSIASPDGTVSLFVGGSQPLVLASHAMRLSTGPDAFDPTTMAIGIETPSGQAELSVGQLSGGAIAGLLEFQRTDLVDARNILGRLALATTTLMNEQHHLGLTLGGAAGGDMFLQAALPPGLSARGNTGNAVVGLAVSDATAFSASDYELRFEAGQVDVVRVSDGTVSSFASLPATVDGLTVSITSGTAQVGDRFLLRPFSTAAGGVAMALGSPGTLAVAAPVTALRGAANQGDLAVASVQAVAADANLGASVTLTFNGAGGFDVTGTGTGNPTNVPYVPGQPIQYNGWSLVLGGTPRAGDTLQVSATAGATRNAQQAQGFLALRDRATFDGAPLADGYAGALAQVGARVQAVRFAADVSGSIASEAASSESAVSGVNLDEEAARLLQYQQSYQAAARILQVAQSVFDSLMRGLDR